MRFGVRVTALGILISIGIPVGASASFLDSLAGSIQLQSVQPAPALAASVVAPSMDVRGVDAGPIIGDNGSFLGIAAAFDSGFLNGTPLPFGNSMLIATDLAPYTGQVIGFGLFFPLSRVLPDGSIAVAAVGESLSTSPLTDPALQSLIGTDLFDFSFLSSSANAMTGSITTTYQLKDILHVAQPAAGAVALAQVPEPNSIWFVALSGMVFLVANRRRRAQQIR